MLKFSRYLEERSRFDTTLQYHTELNDKLWNGQSLRPEIREALLKIGHAWAEYARIPADAIQDIVMTGGNANYNYTNMSDIDLHLQVDLQRVPVNSEVVDEWLYDKKVLWTDQHPNIRVRGYPVELFAEQPGSEDFTTKGAFSLMNNHWISVPQRQNVEALYSDRSLIRKVKYYARRIDELTDADHPEPSKNLTKIRRLKNSFWKMRSSSIQRAGELALENLVFKSLRNLGKIDQLNAHLETATDKSLSLESTNG